mgnify:CR=1 FL=1
MTTRRCSARAPASPLPRQPRRCRPSPGLQAVVFQGARRNPGGAPSTRRDEISPNYSSDSRRRMRKLVDTLPGKSYVDASSWSAPRSMLNDAARRPRKQSKTSSPASRRDYHATQARHRGRRSRRRRPRHVGGRDYGASQTVRPTPPRAGLLAPGPCLPTASMVSSRLNRDTGRSASATGARTTPAGHPFGLGVADARRWCARSTSCPGEAVDRAGRQVAEPGQGRPRRDQSVAAQRRLGLRAPLPDTPSMPIGADEADQCVDHATGGGRIFAELRSAWFRSRRMRSLEVRTGAGDLVCALLTARNGKKPVQAITRPPSPPTLAWTMS